MYEVGFSQAGCRNCGYWLVCEPTQLRWSSVRARRVTSSSRGSSAFHARFSLRVVVGQIRIGADLLVARCIRPRAVECRRDERRIGLVRRRHRVRSAVGEIARGDLPHIFAIGPLFVAPWLVADHDAQRLALSPHPDGRRFCGFGFPGLGGLPVVIGRLGIPRQNAAAQPGARHRFHQCGRLAFPAAVAAGAVNRAGVDRQPIAAVGRGHGYAAECVDPSPGDAGAAESLRDAFERGGAPAQRRHEGLPKIVVGLRHRFRRVQHRFQFEPGLVALQQRPDRRRRFGERGLQRLLDPSRLSASRSISLQAAGEAAAPSLPHSPSRVGPWLEARRSSSIASGGSGYQTYRRATASAARRREADMDCRWPSKAGGIPALKSRRFAVEVQPISADGPRTGPIWRLAFKQCFTADFRAATRHPDASAKRG